VGAALLDQSVIAGIGNVFRAEALFACGQHPSRPAASLTRAEFDRLWATVRAMMGHAVEDGRILTVDPPAGRSRTEIPEDEARYFYKQACCRRCGAPVAYWILGGRTAYACPVEQLAA
jgi:formamidopyrimidine-DNA glycosylase